MISRILGLTAIGFVTMVAANGANDGFPHDRHEDLFPSCVTGHAGAEDSTRAIWPTVESCAACHDGEVEDSVSWTPRSEPPPTNLRFSHPAHREASVDTVVGCVTCHSGPEAAWMDVSLTEREQCMLCHEIESHLEAADSTCVSCHVPLPLATAIDSARIGDFEAPDSHQRDGFATTDHWAGGARGARSCSVCHAREFCTQCHVNAPELRELAELGSDSRSLAIPAALSSPASHSEHDFVTGHGIDARDGTCATCHTRESCVTCHRARPDVAAGLFAAGPGRAEGAVTVRNELPTHTEAMFEQNHGVDATASPQTCAGCHVREDCLNCHVTDAARASSYHEAGFLIEHPAAAFNRTNSCATCHNSRTFCVSCHAQGGLVASGRFASGYHDGSRTFSVGHGQAARQTLETCITCHTERDCASCHSARTGRRFNPHGPGFDAERLKRKNAEMCTACHGVDVP